MKLPCTPRRGLLRRFAILCVCLLPWLTGAPSAHAAAGLDPYDPIRSDETISAEVLLLRAEQGDPRAAFLLGTRYASGRTGARDDSEALRWFRVASELGLAEAQYNLALMLSGGRGQGRDYAEALRWYEAAGEQGLAEAQFNAAMLRLEGAPGVAADPAGGVEWLRKAADRGLARAEFNLGVLSEFGRGVARDPMAASAWYERAARQGYQPARDRLAALRAGSGTVRTSSTPAAMPAVPPAGAGSEARPTPPASSGTAGGARATVEVNRWVLARDPAHYTLQLFSRRDEEGAREFLERHRIGDDGGYFRTRNDGTLWYAVVYGDFESQAAAEAAAKRLPSAFRIKKPWLRNFGVIQKVLER